MEIEERVTRIEKALDAAMPGWKSEDTWPAGLRERSRRDGPDLPASFAGSAPAETKELHVDEEQTKRDRQALGFDQAPADEEHDPKPQKTDEELRKEEEALVEARRRDDETRRQQEIEKARADAAASEKGPIRAADQYADPPGGAMKQPEGDAPAPLAAPPGAAGGGRPPVEHTGESEQR